MMNTRRSVSNLPNSAYASFQVSNIPTLGLWGDADNMTDEYAYDFTSTLETGSPGIMDKIGQVQDAEGIDWISALAKVAQSLVVADSQKQYLAANLELARAGKPPLDASNYGLGVSVGMDANTRKMVGFAVAGALGIAALAVMNSRRRNR